MDTISNAQNQAGGQNAKQSIAEENRLDIEEVANAAACVTIGQAIRFALVGMLTGNIQAQDRYPYYGRFRNLRSSAVPPDTTISEQTVFRFTE